MSAHRTIREPSWAGLQPGLPELIPIGDALQAELCAAVGRAGRVHGLVCGGGSGDTVLFRHDPPAGPSCLLKLLPDEPGHPARAAEAIARWLRDRGAPVAAPLEGFPVPFTEGRLVTVAPYLDGRRVAPTDGDMTALGAALGHLHAILADHPDRDDWQAATARRMASLSRLRAELAAGDAGIAPAADRLRALAADESLDFVLGDLPARPLHGDFNPGNVLVVDGRIVVLDFEDVVHSVLPPMLELALAIERFVLVQVSDDGRAEALGRAFLTAYAGAVDTGPLPSGCDPVAALRSLSLRSLLVLEAGRRAGIEISATEWEKFHVLERQAGARADCVRAIFQGLEP